MDRVSIRDLRNHGGDVIGRVVAGERLLVTRDGVAVAELSPVRTVLPATALLVRSRSLPRVDAARFREDVDAVLDPSL